MHLSPQKNKKTDQFAPEKEPFSIFEVIFQSFFRSKLSNFQGCFYLAKEEVYSIRDIYKK